jgi:YggT family protein
MSDNYLIQAVIFLITTVFDIYLLAVVLRFLLQLFRADFYNPISQFLVKITNPPLRYIRRVVPGYKGQDWSSLVLMLVIKSFEITIVYLLSTGSLLAISSLIILSIAGILEIIVHVFMIAIFIQIILSWVNPGAYNPATVILYRLTEPVLAPARKVLPPISGLDLSPILVIIALQLSIILIVTPLTHFGVALSN